MQDGYLFTYVTSWLLKQIIQVSIKRSFLATSNYQKTRTFFSAIAIDQVKKQHNATVKGDGEAVGLTENLQKPRLRSLGGWYLGLKWQEQYCNKY